MLGKLLKYEFRSTARQFCLWYAALLVISFITGLSMRWTGGTRFSGAIETASVVFSLLFFFLVAAVVVLTFVLIIQRFYKNLLQNEGYLMHTLPVTMGQHILAKLLVAVFWFFASTVIVILSIFLPVLLSNDGVILFSVWAIPDFIRSFGQLFDCNGLVAIVLILLLIVVAMAVTAMFFYLCLAIGHLASRRKLLCSFGAYVVLQVAVEILLVVVLNLLDDVHLPFPDLPLYGYLLVCIAGCTAVCAVLFAITNLLMKKRLNLE